LVKKTICPSPPSPSFTYYMHELFFGNFFLQIDKSIFFLFFFAFVLESKWANLDSRIIYLFIYFFGHKWKASPSYQVKGFLTLYKRNQSCRYPYLGLFFFINFFPKNKGMVGTWWCNKAAQIHTHLLFPTTYVTTLGLSMDPTLVFFPLFFSIKKLLSWHKENVVMWWALSISFFKLATIFLLWILLRSSLPPPPPTPLFFPLSSLFLSFWPRWGMEFEAF